MIKRVLKLFGYKVYDGSDLKKIIGKYNALVMNSFQLQGTPDLPFSAYDERVCLVPAVEEAQKEIYKYIETVKARKELHHFILLLCMVVYYYDKTFLQSNQPLCKRKNLL